MNKKMTAVILAGMILLSGCGGAAGSTASEASSPAESASSAAEQSAEENVSEDVPVDQSELEEFVDTDDTPIVEETVADAGIDAFVKLGDYKGLELTKTVMTVTDEEVEEEIRYELEASPITLPEDTLIEEGLVANIDFVGKLDGEPFDGGTDEGYDLLIGSHSFVDTFEEQLIGHKAGDEVLVTVTFPDDYLTSDLQGKVADFEVTINSVRQYPTELTDEWAAENSNYATAEEFRASIRQQMQEYYDYMNESQLENDAWAAVSEKAEFLQYPKDLYDQYYELMDHYIKDSAEMYGMEVAEFLEMNNLNESYIGSEAKNYVRQDLLTLAILSKEGLDPAGKEVEAAREELLSRNGLASVEEALENGIQEQEIEFSARNSLALDRLVASANVTEQEGTAEE